MAKHEREQALYWIGPTDAAGNPTEGLSGINATDLDSFYINELSDEQYQAVLDSPYYQKTKPKGHDAAAAAPSAEQGEEG